MDRLDRSIRNELRKEAPKMPEHLSEAYDRTLNLVTSHDDKKRNPFGRRSVKWYSLASCAASFLVLFLAVNASADVAYAMQKIPVIGDVIRVITVRDYHFEDEKHYADVVVPEVEATEELSEDADYINDCVDDLTNAVLEEFKKDVAKYPDDYMGLDVNYNVLINNENWFSLCITIERTAASATTDYVIYNIDKKRNEIVSLGELFTEEFDYITAISDNIVKQMKQQMKEDDNKIYFLSDEEEGGFEKIHDRQNFYKNRNGDLVIVFDKYEVAPGSMGNPEFVIPKEVYNSFLQSL